MILCTRPNDAENPATLPHNPLCWRATSNERRKRGVHSGITRRHSHLGADRWALPTLRCAPLWRDPRYGGAVVGGTVGTPRAPLYARQARAGGGAAAHPGLAARECPPAALGPQTTLDRPADVARTEQARHRHCRIHRAPTGAGAASAGKT